MAYETIIILSNGDLVAIHNTWNIAVIICECVCGKDNCWDNVHVGYSLMIEG